MSVVRSCLSGKGGHGGGGPSAFLSSASSLRTAFADIAQHSTGFHLKLVDFGAKCAARARENGGEEEETEDSEPVVVGEDAEEEAVAAAAAAAAITQREQEEQQRRQEAAAQVDGDSLAVVSEGAEKLSAAATAAEEKAAAPQAELRDRYALGALKRVRYKLDGASPCSLRSLARYSYTVSAASAVADDFFARCVDRQAVMRAA